MSESRRTQRPRLWGGTAKGRAEADEWTDKVWSRRFGKAEPASLEELIAFLGVDRHDYVAQLMSEAPNDSVAGRTLGRRATLHCPTCDAPRTLEGCDECGPIERPDPVEFPPPTLATHTVGLSTTRYRAWAKFRRRMGHVGGGY